MSPTPTLHPRRRHLLGGTGALALGGWLSATSAQAQQRASAVADRAAELAAGSRHRVASCIPPLPTRPESTNDEH